jgi:gustatory receptor
MMLIVRMLAVYLYASMVNDTSLLPLKVIQRLPITNWNLEIRRFYSLLCNDQVALSGLGFFSFTKSIILSVAGQIATYLIVMLQHEFGVVYQQAKVSHCGWIEKVQENIIVD